MHIYLKRSGGFTGAPLQADLDTSSLSADEAEAIEQMLADINFFDLQSDPAPVSGVDRFTYELRVVSGEIEHTVCFPEQNTPLEINTLMRQLIILARRPAPGAAADPSSPKDTSQQS